MRGVGPLLAATALLSAACADAAEDHDARTSDGAVEQTSTGPAAVIGHLEIHTPQAPVPAAGDQTALYVVIRNTGPEPDTLLFIDVPGAEHSAVHRSTVEDGVARMGPAGPLAIEAGGELVLAPGGLHGMITGLEGKLSAGDTLAVTLGFARAGDVHLRVRVVPYAALEGSGA